MKDTEKNDNTHTHIHTYVYTCRCNRHLRHDNTQTAYMTKRDLAVTVYNFLTRRKGSNGNPEGLTHILKTTQFISRKEKKCKLI